MMGTKEDCIMMAKSGRIALCWICKNAVPNPITCTGCNWSKKSKPVDGWKAREKMMKIWGGGEVVSYFVTECPEFIEG